ncbi:MAG TPA: hypothetical protein VN653_00705, partial [Anaerolineales bacterium]|nr:hypothetical protein [Anaerolineales bacterium]
MKTIIQSRVAILNGMINRLRTRIPGLPSNRVLRSAGGLVFIVGAIFVALQVLLAPKQPVGNYTMPYTQNFDAVDLKHWFSQSGVWTIRTGTLAQTVGGDEAGQLHIPLKVPADQAYHASVYITLKKDSKNVGLSFNAQYPNLIAEQQRVYIDRISKDELTL